MRIGPLQEHVDNIGTLSVIIDNTLDPVMRRNFNLRLQALYFSLCKIFGMDEAEKISGSIVFIMAQTVQFGMSTILDFANFLAQEIHSGLVGIAHGKVDKPFCWYSLLMYVCLYKGVTYFSKDGERNSI